MGITPKQLLAKYVSQAEMSSFFVDNMGIINVKNYGVLPDTTAASQTTKINDAIDAAIDNGSAVLYFPAGVYFAGTALSSDSTSVVFVGDGASFSTQGSTYALYQIWTPSVRTINSIEHHNGDITITAGTSNVTVTPTTSYTIGIDVCAAIKGYSTTIAQHTSEISTLQTETTNLRTDLNAHTTDTSKHLNIMTAAGDMVYNSTAASPVATVLPITGGKFLKSTTDAVPKPTWGDPPGGDGGWELIASTFLDAASTTPFTISSIPSTYRMIKAVGVFRMRAGSGKAAADMAITINNSTVYIYTDVFNATANARSQSDITAYGGITEATSDSPFAKIEVNITNLGYSPSNIEHRQFNGVAYTTAIEFFSGRFKSTDPVNTIKFDATPTSSLDLGIGSGVYVLGIK